LEKLRETAKTAKRPPRLVVVSSESHRQIRNPRLDLDRLWVNAPSLHRQSTGITGYHDIYGQSKLANVLFTKEFYRRYGQEIDAFSLHPGALIATEIGRFHSLASIGFKVLSIWTRSINQGAATTLYCATDEKLTGHGGGYYHGCKLSRESNAAKDPEQAKLLWEQSESHFHRLLKEKELKSNL